MSKLETITIDTPSGSNTMQIGSTNTATINLGASGDTINIPAGATIANAGTATGFSSTFGSSYFAANRTSDFTVTDQTFVKAQINNEIVDVGNNYDTSNYRYTAPAAGKYFFYVRGYMDAEVDSHLHAVEYYLKKNNSTYVAETIIDFQSNNGRKGGTTLTTIVDLSASDYIEWWIYAKDSTGNPVLKSNGGSSASGAAIQFGGWRVA